MEPHVCFPGNYHSVEINSPDRRLLYTGPEQCGSSTLNILDKPFLLSASLPHLTWHRHAHVVRMQLCASRDVIPLCPTKQACILFRKRTNIYAQSNGEQDVWPTSCHHIHKSRCSFLNKQDSWRDINTPRPWSDAESVHCQPFVRHLRDFNKGKVKRLD